MLISILLALLPTSPGEELLVAYPAPDGIDRLVGTIGDHDGDGTPDLFSLQVGAQPELIDLVSGRTSRVLASFPVIGSLPGSARVAVAVGDVDGDGRADIGCGFPLEAFNDGAVRIYSTADGTLLHELLGSADQLGTAVAGGHDYDGDGRDDFLVSALGASPRVTLHSGSTGAVIGTWAPPTSEAAYGTAVALLDDLDGDQVPELGVGSPFVVGGGRVWIYSGAAGSVLGVVDRGFPWGGFGSVLAAVGDVDGDGLGEYVVGGPTGTQVRAQVLSGTSGIVVHDLPGTGAEVAGLGDVDGDGVVDFVTTNPLEGSLEVWSGADGAAVGELRGAHPASAGDLDQDGQDDIAFAGAEPFSWNTATVTLAFGFAPAPHERYGTGGGYVGDLGDLDLDGFDDYALGGLVISGRDATILRSYNGAPHAVDDLDGDGFRDLVLSEWSQGVVVVRVYSFMTGQVLLQFSQSGVFNTGIRIFPGSDLDGDGLGDLMIGTPNASLAKSWAGGVFAYSLGTGVELWEKEGRYSDGGFGETAVFLDDLDGDGVAEVAVGAPLEDRSFFNGQIYVFSGKKGKLLRRIKGALGTWIGYPLAVVGDRDGDGIRDLATTEWTGAWPGTGSNSVVYLSPTDGRKLGSIPGDFTSSQGALVGRFGHSIAVVGDYDADGLADLGVGASGFDEGAFFVFAADDGALLRQHQGRIDAERFGSFFAPLDVTGDGLDDVIVMAPYSYGPGGPGYRVELLDASVASSASYCGLQTSSQNCQPQVLSKGTASRSQTSGFDLDTFQLDGGRVAALFFGYEPQQVPWKGGPASLCVRDPLTRTDAHPTGGSSGDCDGSLSIDFNAWMAAHPNQAPAAGTAVFAQVWFDDPGSSSGSGLSNAMVFSVLP